MAVTLGTMLTQVRERLDEDSARFWSEVEIRRWVNEGARDIARRAECLVDQATLTVSQGEQTHSAPMDAVRLHRVEWHPTGQTTKYPLEYRDYNSMDQVWSISQTITEGYPQYWTLWGYPGALNIMVYPKPSTGGSLLVFYYRLPADLATDGTDDAQNIDIPEGWHDAIAMYAEYTGLRKDGDQRWMEAKAEYEQRVDDLIHASRRWTDTAGSIDYDGRLLPWWLWQDEVG